MNSLNPLKENQNKNPFFVLPNAYLLVMGLLSFIYFYALGSRNADLQETVLYFICICIGGLFTSVYLASYANKTEKSKDSTETSNHLEGSIFKSKTSTPSTKKSKQTYGQGKARHQSPIKSTVYKPYGVA